MAALLAAAILGADATVDEKANDIDPNACPEEAPQPTARARVRRSISTLTDDEWDRVTDAMWVMRTTDTPTGQARYGSQYYDWEYFVLRHVVSSVCIDEDDAWRDPDLDTTGHDLFAIWHGVQLVEFENALVSVDPQIDGLPYLDYKEIANVHIAARLDLAHAHGSTSRPTHACTSVQHRPASRPRSHTHPHHTPLTPPHRAATTGPGQLRRRHDDLLEATRLDALAVGRRGQPRRADRRAVCVVARLRLRVDRRRLRDAAGHGGGLRRRRLRDRVGDRDAHLQRRIRAAALVHV